jgi:hypothetical protein
MKYKLLFTALFIASINSFDVNNALRRAQSHGYPILLGAGGSLLQSTISCWFNHEECRCPGMEAQRSCGALYKLPAGAALIGLGYVLNKYKPNE